MIEYIRDMLAVLRLDAAVWPEMAARGRTLRYTVANVLVLGLIYGASAVYFSQWLLATRGVTPEAARFNPLMVLLVGASVAFLMHGGGALFVWVFSRGIGGGTALMPLYLNVGAAAVALWPAAPAVALLQTGVRAPGLVPYLLIALGYGLVALYPAVRHASGLSHLRMTVAGVVTLFYVGCLLYLWL